MGLFDQSEGFLFRQHWNLDFHFGDNAGTRLYSPLTLTITSAAARTREGKVHEMKTVKRVLRVPADRRKLGEKRIVCQFQN